MNPDEPNLFGVALTLAAVTGPLYGVFRWLRKVGWNRVNRHTSEEARYLWDGLMAFSLGLFCTTIYFTT